MRLAIATIAALLTAFAFERCTPPDAGLQQPAFGANAQRRLPTVPGNGGAPAIWLTNTSESYLVGLDETGRKTVKLIDVESAFPVPAYYPVAVKIDHDRNIWSGNEYNDAKNGGDVQEYDAGGKPKNDFRWNQCLPSATYCTGYGFDSAATAHNVFATATFYDSENASAVVYGSGVEVFQAKDDSKAPTLISTGSSADGGFCKPICSVYFMDVDPAGNIWFDFEGYNGTITGGGLGEISNPASSPKVTVIFPAGTYGSFAGGVYISAGGTTLNVTDPANRLTYQYHLPVTSSSTPFNTLGPTKANELGAGDPIAGGFNKNDSKMAIGDGLGWLDLGDVHANRWRIVISSNFQTPSGAAYTPSDK